MRDGKRAKSLFAAQFPSVPLPFHALYHPCGYPLIVKSNHPQVIEAAYGAWANTEQRFEERPLELSITVSDQWTRRCPPNRVWHVQQNLLLTLANPNNFAICDLTAGFASAYVTRSSVAAIEYVRCEFVEKLAHILLESLYVVALPASCIAKGGRSVLIFEKPAGRQRSLANAAVERGWTLISDRTTYCARRKPERVVFGEFPPTRFEILDHVVFVKSGRRRRESALLSPALRNEASAWLTAAVSSHGLPFQQERLETVNRLLGAHIYELIHSDLEAAIDVLEQIVHRLE
jgi:hypothetical protein